MSDDPTTRDDADSGSAARARWLDGLLGDLPARPAHGGEPELPWPSTGEVPADPAAAAVPASHAGPTAVRLPLRLPPGLEETGEAKLIRIEISGLPPGAAVTPARKLDKGTFAVSPEDGGRLALDLDLAEIGDGPLRLGFKTVAEDPVDGSVLTTVSAREIAVPRAPRPSVPAAMASAPPPAAPPPAKLPDFAADLDISVGIDDPMTLRGIGITILGVPSGGRLSAGEETAPGRWEMTADKLAGLTITVPGETGDFTLEVMLETGDGEVQSAEIGVSASAAAPAAPPPEEFAPAAAPALSEPEPPAETASSPRPQPVDGGSGAIVVRLGSEPYRGDPHYRLYADGRQIADGNLDWEQPPGSGALVWQDVVVPWAFETAEDRPAEIAVRFETEASRSGGAAERTLALGFVEVDGLRIPAEAAEVAASEGWITWRDADGMPHRSWNGELTIDVAAAFARLAPEGPEAAAAATAGEAGVPSAGPATADEPAAAPAEERPVHDPSLLVIPAEERDLARPGFLAEIVELRTFVRAAAAGEIDDAALSGNRLYGRLGLDVGRWGDVALRDVRGRDIPLDLPAPRLAPRKGRAFAQDRRRLGLGDVVAGDFGDVVEVSGMPPGALLDVGENLGGGRWRLTAAEARHAHLLMPFGGPQGGALEAALRHGADGPAVRRHTVHAGRPGDGGPLHEAMHRVRLPLSREVFDPRRYGNVTLTLADVPPGALLSRGTNHGDGVWTVEGWEGERVALLAAGAPRGRHGIHVTAMSFDEHSGETEIVARDVLLDAGHEAVVLASPLSGSPSAPR